MRYLYASFLIDNNATDLCILYTYELEELLTGSFIP